MSAALPPMTPSTAIASHRGRVGSNAMGAMPWARSSTALRSPGRAARTCLTWVETSKYGSSSQRGRSQGARWGYHPRSEPAGPAAQGCEPFDDLGEWRFPVEDHHER